MKVCAVKLCVSSCVLLNKDFENFLNSIFSYNQDKCYKYDIYARMVGYEILRTHLSLYKYSIYLHISVHGTFTFLNSY